jgi:proteic killer suppression protein
MIKGFADEATEAVFRGFAPKGLPAEILSAARRKLRYIDAATELKDLKAPPGNKLHPLWNDRVGQHAIWINAKYRICFRWRSDGVYGVGITDYH